MARRGARTRAARAGLEPEAQPIRQGDVAGMRIIDPPDHIREKFEAGMSADDLRALMDDPEARDWIGEMQGEAQRLQELGARQVSVRGLRSLNDRAKRAGYNRTLTEAFLDALDTNRTHLLVPTIEHHFANGQPVQRHIRCQVTGILKGRYVFDQMVRSDDIAEQTLDVSPAWIDRFPRTKPFRRPKPPPQWEHVLQLYTDLIEATRINPPIIGLSGANTKGKEELLPLPVEMVQGLEPWFLGKETITLVEAAATSMPSHELTFKDLPTMTGFAVLERPIYFDLPEHGECPITAVSWKPVTMSLGAEPELLCTVWIDIDRDDSPPNIDSVGYRSRLWPGLYFMWPQNQTVDAVFDWWNADDETKIALLESRKFLSAMWLLAQQQVMVVSGRKPTRAMRRAAMRMKLPSTVNVVTLRRALVRTPEGGEPREVEWSHRWPVTGHWRRIWSDKENRLRTIWVSPYIKGPPDKPLIVKDRFYRFVR